jgi:hypothetical protein
MHNAKKIKDDIIAEGHHVDNETLRQTYILPNFEKGKSSTFSTWKLFVANG